MARRRTTYYGYQFDGVDAKLTFPHHSALNFTNTDAWTFETWAYFTQVSGSAKYLYHKYDTGLDRGIHISSNPDKLAVRIKNGTSNLIDVVVADLAYTGANLAQDAAFPVNKWIHIVVSYSGSSAASGVKIYFDGKEYVTKTTTSNSLSATTQNTSSVLIGSNGTVYSDHYQALTRMFNVVLTPTQIESLFNRGLPKYTHGLSGCVFEMKVINDTFSTNFTVLETANSNNGVSAGMISTQKFKITNLDGLQDMSVQNYTGSSIYYDTFGRAGGSSALLVMHSPFTDRIRTPIVYDSVSGNTYIGWVESPELGYNKRSRLLAVMHLAKTVTPSGYANYTTPGINDGHDAPGICITPSGEVLLVHEESHNAVMYVERTVNKSVGSLTSLSTIPGLHSYPNLDVLGSNIFLFVRGSDSWSNGTFEDSVLYKSTDNGATWNGTKVLNTDTNAGYWERPYILSIYGTSKLRYMICMLDDSAVKFTKIYYIESSDGITFSNISGSFSKNISSSGFITKAELESNCLALENAGTDVLSKAAVRTSSGMIVSINNYDTGAYKVLYSTGGAWSTKTLSIPNYVATGQSSGYRVDFFVLYSYSDTHFVFWRVEARGGFDVVVQYETTDFFTTVDAGTIVSATNLKHEQLQGTHNLNSNKIVIAANQVGTYNKLFIYEFTP